MKRRYRFPSAHESTDRSTISTPACTSRVYLGHTEVSGVVPAPTGPTMTPEKNYNEDHHEDRGKDG